MKQFISILWNCWFWQNHDWTCAAEQGIEPTPKQLADGVAGFYDYATMYCKRCGTVSKLSKVKR